MALLKSEELLALIENVQHSNMDAIDKIRQMLQQHKSDLAIDETPGRGEEAIRRLASCYHLAEDRYQIVLEMLREFCDETNPELLHIAAFFSMSDYLESLLFSSLLARRPLSPDSAFGEEKIPLVFYAIARGGEQMLRMLFDQGADPFIVDANGRNIFHILVNPAVENPSARLLDEKARKGMLNILLNTMAHRQHSSFRRIGCDLSNQLAIQSLLNAKDSNGRTPVHFAAEQGKNYLLYQFGLLGADFSIVDAAGKCAREIINSGDGSEFFKAYAEVIEILPTLDPQHFNFIALNEKVTLEVFLQYAIYGAFCDQQFRMIEDPASYKNYDPAYYDFAGFKAANADSQFLDDMLYRGYGKDMSSEVAKAAQPEAKGNPFFGDTESESIATRSWFLVDTYDGKKILVKNTKINSVMDARITPIHLSRFLGGVKLQGLSDSPWFYRLIEAIKNDLVCQMLLTDQVLDADTNYLSPRELELPMVGSRFDTYKIWQVIVGRAVVICQQHAIGVSPLKTQEKTPMEKLHYFLSHSMLTGGLRRHSMEKFYERLRQLPSNQQAVRDELALNTFSMLRDYERFVNDSQYDKATEAVLSYQSTFGHTDPEMKAAIVGLVTILLSAIVLGTVLYLSAFNPQVAAFLLEDILIKQVALAVGSALISVGIGMLAYQTTFGFFSLGLKGDVNLLSKELVTYSQEKEEQLSM